MKKNCALLITLAVIAITVKGQQTPLFRSEKSLNLQATGSIKSIKKNTNDSTLVTGNFKYQDSLGNWINIVSENRVRGNFRLRNCHFPPLKIKFSKKDIVNTVFEGNKSLKLVLPCETSGNKNMLIRKEYLCYKFYETLSPYHFRTRLANLQLTETSKKNPKTYDLLTFFVEDNSMVAKRANGKILDSRRVDPRAFEEKQSLRNDYFQFMIGNADWSAVYQHNANVLYAADTYITLSYDFDMSGFVNADYAQANPPKLGTGDPRERVYRGFCKSRTAMEEIRQEFLNKESAVTGLIDKEASHFSNYELSDMRSYIKDFFDILKDDGMFKTYIVESCRTNP